MSILDNQKLGTIQSGLPRQWLIFDDLIFTTKKIPCSELTLAIEFPLTIDFWWSCWGFYHENSSNILVKYFVKPAPATANVQLSDFMFKLKQLFSSRHILGNTGTSAVFGNDHGTATGKTSYMVDFSMANWPSASFQARDFHQNCSQRTWGNCWELLDTTRNYDWELLGITEIF